MISALIILAAKSLDATVAKLHDHFSGNKARRIELHRRAGRIADEIRAQRITEKRAHANVMLGRVPTKYRLMLELRADYHKHAA